MHFIASLEAGAKSCNHQLLKMFRGGQCRWLVNCPWMCFLSHGRCLFHVAKPAPTRGLLQNRCLLFKLEIGALAPCHSP